MKAHPKHPRCPSCGMAMYKSPIKGKQVKASDPWAFCRNQKCRLCAQDQSGGASGAVGAAKPAKPKGNGKKPSQSRKAKPSKPAPRPESEPVSKARARIRALLSKAVPEGTDKATVGIVLALVSQETGNHRAANALIDEYGLVDALGIARVEDGALDAKRD